MRKTALLFIALLSGLGTLLYGQKTPAAEDNFGPVSLAALVFSPTTIPNGAYALAYSPQPLTVSGGMAPYTFSVSAGNLPPGMALSTDGIISGTPTAAGTYTFTVTALDNTPSPGQVSGTQDYTLVIGKAALTITAGSASKPYGAALPALGVSYTGFVNGDNAASLTTPPTVATTATAASPVGTYPTTASGAVAANYTLTYSPGVLTVTAVALTITANNASMTYGGAVPALTVAYTGFANGDNAASLTTQPTAATTATSASPAGTYPINASGAVDPNYTYFYLPGTLPILQATLTP